MITIKMVGSAARMLQTQQKQVRFAMLTAMNQTAFAIRAELAKRMPAELDRPKPSTLKSIQVEKAKKEDLTAVIRYKKSGEGVPSDRFLPHNVTGGGRPDKRSELMLSAAGLLPDGMQTVPGAAAQLDAYGNMSRGQIVSILSFFKTFGQARWKETRTGRAGGVAGDLLNSTRMNRAARSRSNKVYFVVMPGDPRLPAGIWQRQNKSAKPILMFVRRGRYQPRIKMKETGRLVVKRDFNRLFDAAYSRALATAR
jgi:hypothetical protein